ncbi:MAG TPA: STAS domain-containing protein [Actinomycetota bacterium]|nr:STAS domain-containing protein [Actinomycetota bacterium]
MTESLFVEPKERGSWTVVDVKGEIDLDTAPQLKAVLGDAIKGGAINIAVNLEGVEFLDSSGLGVLIGSLKRCKEAGGMLALVSPRRPIRKVLSITGLDKVIPIHDTVEEATSA